MCLIVGYLMAVKVMATIQINPDAPDALQTYFETTSPLLENVGARVVERFALGEPIVGESLGESLMIVEYPDLLAVDGVFGSEAYKAIIPVRDKAFLKYNICVLGD